METDWTPYPVLCCLLGFCKCSQRTRFDLKSRICKIWTLKKYNFKVTEFLQILDFKNLIVTKEPLKQYLNGSNCEVLKFIKITGVQPGLVFLDGGLWCSHKCLYFVPRCITVNDTGPLNRSLTWATDGKGGDLTAESIMREEHDIQLARTCRGDHGLEGEEGALLGQPFSAM